MKNKKREKKTGVITREAFRKSREGRFWNYKPVETEKEKDVKKEKDKEKGE